VLGGIVKAAAQLFDSEFVEDRIRRLEAMKPDAVEKILREGSLRGLQELSAMHEKSLAQAKRVLTEFER
jgi:hypothetical protein